MPSPIPRAGDVKFREEAVMFRKLFFAFVLRGVASFGYANSPGSCSPIGSPFPSEPFDWVANGEPPYDGCWNKGSTTSYHDASIDGSPAWCNGAHDRYWQLDYGFPQLNQTIPITHATPSTLSFVFYLDFEDPHYDSTDVVYATVYDLTAGTTLYSTYFLG